MNLFKKKIQLFCISNIMVSLVSTNIASATYTYKEEQSALAYAQMETQSEELEPVSQLGDKDENTVVEEAPHENVVVQREVAGTMNYVPARYSEVTGQAVVDYAKRYLGLRYVSGGYSLSTGTDCSGFTKLIFSEFGVYLPRSVSGQMYSGSYVRRDDLRKGDIIIYGNGGGYATHVGIYIGDNLVLHESNPRDGVKISTVYMMQYITARRVINDTAISIVEKQVEDAKKEENTENEVENANEEEASLENNEGNPVVTDDNNNTNNDTTDTTTNNDTNLDTNTNENNETNPVESNDNNTNTESQNNEKSDDTGTNNNQNEES